MGVAPSAVQANHSRQGAFLKTGVSNIAIVTVFVGMSQFLTSTHIPCHTTDIASTMERVAKQAIIGLMFRLHIQYCTAFRLHRGIFKDQDTGHGIRTIHKAGRALKNTYIIHTIGIDLYTMLVAPLLAFLTHTVINHNNAIIAQSTDYRFGYAISRRDL